MPEVLTTELKSDLERIYKITGDLLNNIKGTNTKSDCKDTEKLLEAVKSGLMDITGTLQKDIFNCDYLITKIRTSR